MGKKAKTSRKGKKAWRANIPTDDIDEFFEKSTKDVLSGGSLSAVPSESLFYVDKTRDLSAKRKIEKHREKVLHCDSLLQRNPFVQPVPSSTLKKSKKKSEELKAKGAKTQDDSKNKQDSASDMVDLWSEKAGDDAEAKRKSKPSLIPAVEVEPPGCSYNPSVEDHQDSLAQAVAAEMQKLYRNELGPEPVPLTVHGEPVDEENMYFLDADDGNDDMEEENLGDNGDAEPEQRPSKTRRVTHVELNRRARRKEQLKAEAEAKKMKKLSKEIDSLPDIIKEIAKEDEDKHNRHARRAIAKQERLKSAPPRLGKKKFEPAPVQVLLSEEISGSLRKLKGCCTLARDRFKSLQKRGLVVPTAKRKRK
ncbi:ribosome biogenesis protein NOP53 [Macadamia integrifolia]|uniref:ribosome biogenesis protein NOP53 n=1 Tax=Macadamia integrifolia TaxID=60698 RepID=UPI001C52EA0A|nr:ribosome biogenesis protein NOP53 [Macadamia integrifolia]